MGNSRERKNPPSRSPPTPPPPSPPSIPSAVPSLSNEERLQKIIARAGIASRRDAERMIADGRVVVNGKIVTELGAKANIRKDTVTVDGQPVALPLETEVHWVAINKPKGLLTTMSDDKSRDTIISLIPKAHELRLVPVGRMPRDSTGLMLLTNEVGWIHALTHPSFQQSRRFEVAVEGTVNEAMIQEAEGGLLVGKDATPLPACKCRLLAVDGRAGLSLLDISIKECSTSLLDEIIEAMGCHMINWKRTAFGPIELRGLRKGDWRELTNSEITLLKQSCQKSETPHITRPKDLPNRKDRY
eukprot:gene7058-7805_t